MDKVWSPLGQSQNAPGILAHASCEEHPRIKLVMLLHWWNTPGFEMKMCYPEDTDLGITRRS